MLADFLRRLGTKYFPAKVCFEKYARDIALGQSSDPYFFDTKFINKNEATEFLNYQDSFGSLFFEDDFAHLLWISKCLHIGASTLLAEMNNYISAVQEVNRGGINSYKRIGWDAHIIYVCQLTADNFVKGAPPQAYTWDFDVKYIYEYFQEVHASLSKTAQFILRAGSFLHDIGIMEDIKDHEEKGIPLTEKNYLDLGITDNNLSSQEILLSTAEIIYVMRVIVGNHQIINQVAAEASDKYIYEKMCTIKKMFSFSAGLSDLLKNELIDMLFLLAAADMIAVDDSLLSIRKFNELVEARVFLKQIYCDDKYQRDYNIFGVKRFISLLPDEKKGNAEHVLASYAEKSEDKHAIVEFLYQIKFMGFAMAVIKPLNDTLKAVKLIDWCRRIACIVKIPADELVIIFDPDINCEKLVNILELELDDIILYKKIFYHYDACQKTIEVNC
ncbi:MAG: hypothetical protein FWG61_06780 [Firmicutes bacterium]|nr:hypothetical protein [Bacillota bacterium]